MTWVVLGLLGALFDAVYFMIIKHAGKKVHYTILASGTFFLTSVSLSIASYFRGFPELGNLFFPALLGSVIVNILSIILYMKMLPDTDLGLGVPMLSFTPVFLMITSFFLLYELPSVWGVVGVILIVLGSYILNLHHLDRHIFAPLHELFRHKGTRAMLVVAVLSSFIVSLDKLVMIESDPFFGSSIATLLISLSFFVIAVLKKEASFEKFGQGASAYLPLGLLLSASVLTFNLAVQQQIVSYVLSVKRLSILFSVVLGCLFLKERHFLQRSIGAALMVIGVVVMVVG